MITHEILSTEKVPINYRVAGLGARSLAYLIDLGVIGLLGFAGLLVASGYATVGRPGLAQAVFQFWLFFLLWGYFLLFEWLWRGQTPGKRLLSIRVIHWRGTAIGFVPAALRNLLRLVDCLPLGYALSFAVGWCNREGRRLGDLAADTLVVCSERPGRLVRSLQEEALECHPQPLSPKGARGEKMKRLAQLSREQKQTLLDLALRREQLRLEERVRLFRSASLYLQQRLEVAPGEHQSDEKFVLELAALLGEQ